MSGQNSPHMSPSDLSETTTLAHGHDADADAAHPVHFQEPAHDREHNAALSRQRTPAPNPHRALSLSLHKSLSHTGENLTRSFSRSSQRSTFSHDLTRPDMSFPAATTNVEVGGMTDEYRMSTAQGYIPGKEALHPVPSRLYRTPTVLADAEKAMKLKDMKFVTWKEDDPEDPRNFSDAYRWYITAVAAMSVVSVAFASAVVTGDFHDIEEEFHVGEVVVALSVTLMVVGFGIGPLAWSPLSELYGRRPLWIIPTIIYVIFNIPCALAKNIQTLLICRFFCGIFASAPLTLAGGTISDVWDNNERGFAIALFAAAPYGGPVLGPIVGGFVGETVGWRWILWVNMIFAGVVACFIMTIPETFAPVLLRKRAARLREETGDTSYTTEQEMFQASFGQILTETLIRPFQMTVTEPILLLMSLFIALIYGLLYAFFFSFPVVFGEDYAWDDGHVGLTFCSVLIGLAIALLVTPQLEKNYAKRAAAKGGRADPEDRLIGMMIGGPFVPISLFIFGWTSPPYVQPGGGNWVGPVSSGIPFGFGMVIIYFSANAYLIDAFPGYVASALAAKTVIRSGAGAAMPLFITQMYHGLGNGWAASLLAFVSLAMIPIPFLFYRFGKSIRARSKRATA
ncbi:MFS general substrate transporter [Punctularia strigosozonata HHB-11173 SS5]|uniref:MFS general substrate transporter n=1 Tax=Punctularia strigosozonata (strain HHB-11173) TaxID=741275 RepID=UPI0004416AF9|nr:MFS general substrate transporter [Punctularia strigosozonata HHB-11173 SS5]EIN07314.1 MFS general substrate transporter [Punctularia strigosozonata HHB-11173 SS5]